MSALKSLPASVLFACTSNTVRSPIAAALLGHLHGGAILVDSAGVRAGQPSGFAAAVMQEIGLDISAHEPKSLTETEDTVFDLVISLSPEAHFRAVELSRRIGCDLESWDTYDPSLISGSRETKLEAYRTLRDELVRRIRRRFPVGRIAAPVSNPHLRLRAVRYK
nr:Protein-tyrosine-phosphatase [uncultured bacterium]